MIPCSLREPNQKLLIDNRTSGLDRILACSATDKSYAMVYSPKGEPFTVDLSFVGERKYTGSGSTLRTVKYIAAAPSAEKATNICLHLQPVEKGFQATIGCCGSAMLGGIVWNLGNLLLVAAIAVAGMSVGFPIGGGIAWVLGIAVNYLLVLLRTGQSGDNDILLLAGVLVIVAAIILSMLSYKRLANENKKPTTKGILLSVAAGLLIAFFYGLVVNAIDPQFVEGGGGRLTPYSGAFFFALGAFLSTFIFNPVFMAKPVQGEPVKMAEYFKGSFRTHLIGVLGGTIWMIGMVVSFMAVGAAGPAISYALSNAAPVVAILWGVFAWKEFQSAPKGTNRLLPSCLYFILLAWF
jgi:glucose uptake protein